MHCQDAGSRNRHDVGGVAAAHDSLGIAAPQRRHAMHDELRRRRQAITVHGPHLSQRHHAPTVETLRGGQSLGAVLELLALAASRSLALGLVRYGRHVAETGGLGPSLGQSFSAFWRLRSASHSRAWAADGLVPALVAGERGQRQRAVSDPAGRAAAVAETRAAVETGDLVPAVLLRGTWIDPAGAGDAIRAALMLAPDTDRDDIAAVQAWIARDVTPALDELADLL